MLDRWRGIYAAIVTPFNEDGTIDEESLVRLIKFLEEGGIKGIYALGTTGEFPHLTQEERFRVAEICVDTISKINLIVNVGDITTKKSIENGRRLEKLSGVDAIATISPYYYMLNQEQLLKHHLVIGKSLELPYFIYYIPQMTKLKMSMETLKGIAELPNFTGLKDSSHDINWYAEASKTIEGKVYLTGSDALILHFLNFGSSGAVAATACVAPKLLSDLMNAFDAGDLPKAKKLQEVVCSLRKLVKRFPPLSGFKALLEYQGICKRFMREPLTAVTDSQMKEIEEYLKHDKELSRYIRRS